MSGNASWSIWPFSTGVIVGENSSGGQNTGAGVNIDNAAIRNSLKVDVPKTISAAQIDAASAINDDVDDGTPAGRAKAKKYTQQQIDKGVFKKENLALGDKAKVSQVDTRPPPVTNGTRVDCTEIHRSFNLATKLTPNTILGDFIYKLPQIPQLKQQSVPAQMGLRPSDIVCNLAHLCLNVWEPIKRKYPNVIMTNSLRTGNSIGAGPHGTGQGMDIQFNKPGGGSIPTGEYFAIAQWVKDNIALDQCLLEYDTAKGFMVAWLHIGIYAGTGKQVAPGNRILTFMNQSVYKPGLHNLGK